MYLAVGKTTAREVWTSIEKALGSSTRVRCLNLLGQFQALRQGDSMPSEYLGRAQLLVEDFALTGRPMTLDELNLYVFRGLRSEFRAMAATLAVSGNPVSIPQLADYLQAQAFIHSDEFPSGASTVPSGFSSAMYVGRGRRQHGDGGSGAGRQQCGGQSRGNHRGRGGHGRGRGGAPRCQIRRSQGHTAVYYYRRYSDAPSTQVNVAVTSDGSSTLDVSSWFPETEASLHATPDAGAMTQIEDYSDGDVLRVGNGTGLGISGIGHALLPSVSKSPRLSNVLHVPELSVSLLTVNRFAKDNNCYFEFHPSFFVVKDCKTKDVLLKGPSSGGLYTLSVPSRPEKAQRVEINEKFDIQALERDPGLRLPIWKCPIEKRDEVRRAYIKNILLVKMQHFVYHVICFNVSYSRWAFWIGCFYYQWV
ncbi:PREDICTED: uncharacterized protein LOC109157442 [Ipomoea nil]|uniref:uncharacterized protein LOC109157442 n=1 Tax=Ipomoea nil TaxID=35883 RepID=UPI000901526F|nr:PREDICTED: uncharacterized protein LOC109157442 [Ipomoea nil]